MLGNHRTWIEILGDYCRIDFRGKRAYISSHDAVRLYRYCLKARNNKTKAWINTIHLQNGEPVYIELKGREIKTYIKAFRKNAYSLKLIRNEEPWKVLSVKKFGQKNLLIGCAGFVDEKPVLAVMLFGYFGVEYVRYIVAKEDIAEIIEDEELQRITYEHYTSPVTQMMALLFG